MKNLASFAVIGMFFVGCASSQPQPAVTPAPKVQTKKEVQNDNKNLKLIQEFVKNGKSERASGESVKKIAKFDDKPVDTKEVKKVLLKTNPLFASKYKKEALKEKVPVVPNTPLYRPPLFAEMIVFPYVSDDGIYHDTQKVWIKIKDGEFVLNQSGKEKERVFGINGGY